MKMNNVMKYVDSAKQGARKPLFDVNGREVVWVRYLGFVPNDEKEKWIKEGAPRCYPSL